MTGADGTYHVRVTVVFYDHITRCGVVNRDFAWSDQSHLHDWNGDTLVKLFSNTPQFVVESFCVTHGTRPFECSFILQRICNHPIYRRPRAVDTHRALCVRKRTIRTFHTSSQLNPTPRLNITAEWDWFCDITVVWTFLTAHVTHQVVEVIILCISDGRLIYYLACGTFTNVIMPNVNTKRLFVFLCCECRLP